MSFRIRKASHNSTETSRATADLDHHAEPTLPIMPAFDEAPDRPEHIDQILNGLDRYNPQTTQVFQEYVQQQCEHQTYDCYANLALLKLYVACPLDPTFPTASSDEQTLPHVLYYPSAHRVHDVSF